MKLNQATENIEKELMAAVKRFQKHYEQHMESTDYYPDDLEMSEWREQFDAFLDLELMLEED